MIVHFSLLETSGRLFFPCHSRFIEPEAVASEPLLRVKFINGVRGILAKLLGKGSFT